MHTQRTAEFFIKRMSNRMSNSAVAELDYLFPILTSAELETQDQLIQLDSWEEATLRELNNFTISINNSPLDISWLANHTSTAVSLREQTNPTSTHFKSNLT